MRAFVAADLDDALRDAAVRARERLARSRLAPAGVRFTKAESLHVTLVFLGEVDAALAGAMAAALPPLAGRAVPLALGALDAFPSPERARVVVLGFEDGALAAIAARLAEEAASLGVPREPRAFRAHVTLARLREPRDVRAWIALPPETVRGFARSLAVYESTLEPGGARYAPLARVPLPVG